MLALIAFELAWVDAGAATGSLAGNLGLAPIHERGTPEQRAKYIAAAAPVKPGENRKQVRAAFALTEPLPFVGVETGMLAGKVRVADWKDGGEPLLQVEKRGRFITNMGFANVVTAAVDSDDPTIKGSCMVILEEGDPGVFGPRHAHQKTRPPAFLDERSGFQFEGSRQPHRRRLHRQGRRHHPELFARRNHRGRFPPHARDGRIDDRRETAFRRRAGDSLPAPPVPRRRGRAGHAALRARHPAKRGRVAPARWTSGPPARRARRSDFAPARLFDELDPLEKQKDLWLAEKNLTGRAAFKVGAKKQAEAMELVEINSQPVGHRDLKRAEELEFDPLVIVINTPNCVVRITIPADTPEYSAKLMPPKYKTPQYKEINNKFFIALEICPIGKK